MIERDAKGAPKRFLLLNHLLHAGREQLTKGELENAVSTLAPIATFFSDSLEGQMSLGEAHRASGQREAAIGCFQKALTLAASTKKADRENRILPLLIQSVKTPADPAALDAFAGRYELKPDSITTVVRQGHRLVIQSPTGQWSTLVPDGAITFRLLENPSVLCEFTLDDERRARSLLIRSGGQDLIHKRLP